MGLRLVEHKYLEGNVKRTLERELKVPEIAGREVNGISAICEIAVKGCGLHVLFFGFACNPCLCIWWFLHPHSTEVTD